MEEPILTKLLRSFRRPSDSVWLDGRLVTANAEMTVYHIAFVGGETQQVAPSNPDRIAIGFFTANLGITQEAVAPWPEVQEYPFNATGVQIGEWYTLANYPSIIANAWHAYFINPLSLRVVDVTRNRTVNSV